MLLLAAVSQQPASRQGSAAAPTARSAQQPEPAGLQSSSEAVDSVVSAVTHIGAAVAEVKSSLELYRRAAFNEPAGALLQWAGRFSRSCQELAQAVERHQGKLCRSCLPSQAQRAVDGYRGYMPALARMGRQCSTRVQRVSASTPADSVPARLRREARPIGNSIVEGLRPYEAHLQEVRVAFGWERPPTAPARPR